MQLNENIKKILDLYLEETYDIHVITESETNRPDAILRKYYSVSESKDLQYIFYYMNNITYPLNELIKGKAVKIYNFKRLYDLVKLELAI